MSAFSGFLIVGGVMILFGSAMSIGLTFLHTMQGDAWAPTSTGTFLSYVGVDLGIERLFDWIGWGLIYQAIMQEPLYHVLFILGIVIIFLALATRGMSHES